MILSFVGTLYGGSGDSFNPVRHSDFTVMWSQMQGRGRVRGTNNKSPTQRQQSLGLAGASNSKFERLVQFLPPGGVDSGQVDDCGFRSNALEDGTNEPTILATYLREPPEMKTRTTIVKWIAGWMLVAAVAAGPAAGEVKVNRMFSDYHGGPRQGMIGGDRLRFHWSL
jgi:hypothetical protein